MSNSGREFMGQALAAMDAIGFGLLVVGMNEGVFGLDEHEALAARAKSSTVASAMIAAVATYRRLSKGILPEDEFSLSIRLRAEGGAMTLPVLVWPNGSNNGAHAVQFGPYAAVDLSCDCCPGPVHGVFVDPTTVCCTIGGKSFALHVPADYVPGTPLPT